MKRTNTTLILLGTLFVLLAAARGWTEDQPAGNYPTASSIPVLSAHAEAILVVTSDAKTFNVDHDLISRVLYETYNKERGSIKVDYTPFPNTTKGAVTGGIGVMISGKSDKEAEQVTQNVAEKLETTLVRLANESVAGPLARALALAEENEARASQELRQHLVRQRHLREQLSAADAQAMASQLPALLREALNLRADVAGLEAQQQALVEQIAQKKKDMEAHKSEETAEIRYLRKAADVYQQDYARLREANKRVPGTVAQADIEQAYAKCSMAEAELESRWQAILQEKYGNRLTELANQLSDGEVKLRRATSRQKAIEGAVAEAMRSAAISQTSTDMQMTDVCIDACRQQLRAALEEKGKLELQLRRFQPPRVQVLKPGELFGSGKEPQH